MSYGYDGQTETMQLDVSGTTGSETDVAIIGMACLFPQAADLDAFWRNILGKVYAVGEPTESWGADRYYVASSTSDEHIYTKAGGFLGDLYRFNPTEFGIMPSSIDGQEPDQFLALKVARDALADAGYADPACDHSNTGIVLGHSTYLHRGQATVVQHGIVLDQTLELLSQLYPGLGEDEQLQIRKLLKRKLPPFNTDTAPGLVPNVMTGRIANRLNLMGPNYLIDAACASSLLAVQAAMEELRSGRSDLMLAGGVNASSPAEAFMVFSHLGGLSRNSHIRPFDARADGTLLGEGLGIVALKRLADAKRDGDRIYGLVKAIGQSSDGRALGLLAPRMEGQVLAIERAYRQSGIDPASVSLIEAHGTGIPLGDKTEIQSLGSVMGQREGDLPRCAIGSVKSMISHCIPAAGVAGLIKATLALYYKVLPPTLCDEVNPELGLEKTPFYINTETRPWIHTLARPRRAAVDAFGFGGINTHAVLEEYQDPAVTTCGLREWEHELAVFAAPDRARLREQLSTVADYLAQCDPSAVTLRDVASSLAAEPPEGEQRVAIVASNLDDLLDKIRRTNSALEDDSRHSFKSRKGIYFSATRMAGKLAFVFPGEGAQYQEMFSDLALCFPVVRKWFDFWESIYQENRDMPRTGVVFPPPTAMAEEVREKIEQSLYNLEIGSESMFISSQAMFELLRQLGVEPDVMLGHSSGENSALVASGMVQLGNNDQLREHILRLNRMYKEMETSGEIVTGKLMTVGAVDRNTVREVVDAAGGTLHLALDNCRNQSVLFGDPDAMEKARERFRQEGGLCAYLPFDRAYHTPLFEAVARNIETFFKLASFQPGRYPLYSCVNAGLYPTDTPEEIRHHAAMQWSSSVRFTETIERMYTDNVRFFVEVGPSGNLTAFIDDILRNKEHLAISANNRHRSGLFQLHQLLANLFVQGQSVNMAALFQGRRCNVLDFKQPPPSVRKPAPLLHNTLPYLRLNAEEFAVVSSLLNRSGPGEGVPATQVNDTPEAPQMSPHGEDEAAHYSRALVLQDHFRLMQEFLLHQEQVLGMATGSPTAPPQYEEDYAAQDYPFIQQLLEHTAERAVVEVELDVAQRFIREHILYSSELSDLDPGLHALPVVPLAASLEMLAEVGAVLADRNFIVALENVRAYNWIALDTGAKTIRLEATLVDGEAVVQRIHTAIFEGDNRLLEGDVLFADEAPSSLPQLPPLQNPQVPIWQDHELYTAGMFHGPLYHSVAHLLAWDETGIDAQLAATPVAGFFDDDSRPTFFINPVMMDAVGHLTAFWIAQSCGTDFSCFPSRIDRIELVNAGEQATEGYLMRGRVAFLEQEGGDGRFLQGDYECVDHSGNALFRIYGWHDRFFSVPHSFYYGRTNPRDGWYGEDWSHLYPELSGDYLVWHLPAFPPGFLDDAGAVWKRLLAYTLLSRKEREVWQSLPPNPLRRSEWLLGRIALKEVARCWLARHYGLLLYPADIVILVDASGKPFVAADGLESVGEPPAISLAHAAGYTVAVAGPAESAVGIDLEALGRVNLEDFVLGGFTEQERARVFALSEDRREEFALRLWCSKEAVAKSLGIGLNGNPSQFEVRELSPDGLSATVYALEQQIAVSIRRQGDAIISLAII